ncbi:MAG: hypothetical protein JWL61_2238 [Gemmatimonadetes bacterium]|jgi:hypothetical protein|nr:hypothetical protein [Gemmatimonadota bacterium]
MRTSTTRLLLAAVLFAPAVASAQGTLSVLGFGYPAGQLSTRSLGTGGALGEIDPLSVSNPASILGFGGAALYFQAEPEYRTLTSGANKEKTSIARFPLIVASIPINPTIMVGLSVSNLLDRSFETRSRGSEQVGDSVLATSNFFKSDGAIGDLRLSLAWMPLPWMHLGVAAHAISGDNRVRNVQVFDDSTRFASLIDTATVGYTGNAYSAGIELLPGKNFSLAGSYRHGGPLSLKRGDTTLANARVPDRLAFSAAFLGIKGTTIAVRSAKETWSNMKTLGSSNLNITDKWDTSVGADVLGPRFAGNPIQLRVGGRWRTLPFGLPTSSVDEKSYSIGAGTLLARGRAAIDVAGIRATRSATTAGNLSESAWTLSVGVTVRP